MSKQEAINTLMAIKRGWVGGYSKEELARLRAIANGQRTAWEPNPA